MTDTQQLLAPGLFVQSRSVTPAIGGFARRLAVTLLACMAAGCAGEATTGNAGLADPSTTSGGASSTAAGDRSALRAAAARAHYLSNAGVMVESGGRKILFDPLFDEIFRIYEKLPDPMRSAVMSGTPPYDGVDAVFVSHYHGDHFAPGAMLAYLDGNPAVQLYAPRQAVDGLVAADAAAFDRVRERVVAITLDFDDPPLSIGVEPLQVGVARIAHSGWPDARTDVENLAFRVTLAGRTTVLHLGDADTRDEHYARNAEFWASRPIDMAFPPYWYFLSPRGRAVLETRLKPGQAVGVHVPAEVPDAVAARSEQYRGFDLFVTPGEVRLIR